jgi:hypothetical protein
MDLIQIGLVFLNGDPMGGVFIFGLTRIPIGAVT